MIDKRDRKILIGNAGGNAGKSSLGYKISIPSEWMKVWGITKDNREVEIEFNGEQIIIKKK